MLDIKLNEGLLKEIDIFIRKDLPDARQYGLSKAGYLGKQRLRGYIESGGKGTWPALHPFTQGFYSRYMSHHPRLRPRGLFGKIMYGSAYYEWGRFVRYRVYGRGRLVTWGFDTYAEGTRFRHFDRKMMAAFYIIQKPRSYKVTKKVRRFWAVSRKHFLRKTTKELYVAPHNFMDYLYKNRRYLMSNLVSSYLRSLRTKW